MVDGVMAMSWQKLKYPPIYGGYHFMTNYRTNINPSIIVKVSSEVMPAEESRNLPEARRLSRSGADLTSCQTSALIGQENTVGIIGGFSAFSTLMFLEKLVWWSSRDGKECVPFIVCSDPAIKRELHDLVNIREAQIVENLRHQRVFLEQSGARCIVMPCHLCNVWQREVSKGCSGTFLDIGDCVAKELKEAKLKPLEAGSNVRIGVLAADAALMADKATMEHMVVPAVDALKKKDTEGARNLLQIAIQALLVRAVNRIILASDEFQGLLPCNDPLLKKCVDPMDALAKSTVRWAKSAETFQRNLNGT